MSLRDLTARYSISVAAGDLQFLDGRWFPQNGCVRCAHLGLCLHDQRLIESNLTLAPGASNLAWLDELVD